MYKAARTTGFSNGERASVWEPTLEAVIAEAEAAEYALAAQAPLAAQAGRKASGSFYTPADVADHVWDQFFRSHRIDGADALRRLIAENRIVEPSAGAGMFVFTFLRKALRMGLHVRDLERLRITIIDLNGAALRFVAARLAEIETAIGVRLPGIVLVCRDFLDWAMDASHEAVLFIGNPPFVENAAGTRWRNLYATFLEAMLDHRAPRVSIGLILPMSICFSRDYRALRTRLLASSIDIQASSYDNIPDCLFRAGKPESGNTNKANSQRCTILVLGGTSARREATSLRRWSRAERSAILSTPPQYRDFTDYAHDGQIPRPCSDAVLAYLSASRSCLLLGTWLSRTARPSFAVGAVARNFIGIRNPEAAGSNAIAIAPRDPADAGPLLQIIASPLFYEYWRSIGDGFHVTRELIAAFPVTPALAARCRADTALSDTAWTNRATYAREKLNAGKVVRSYDFREAFAALTFGAW